MGLYYFGQQFIIEVTVEFAEGQAKLDGASEVYVGESSAWTLTFVVGESGLAPGSVIRVTIPTGFSAPQTDNPEAPGYVEAQAGSLDASLSVAVEPLPGGGVEDLREAAGEQAVYLLIEGGTLRSGDQIDVRYGCGNSHAFASSYSGRASFDVWICRLVGDEDPQFRPIKEAPAFKVLAGAIARLEAIAPSRASVGQPIAVRVVARDDRGNRCSGWTGWVGVDAGHSSIVVPPRQRIEDAEGKGIPLEVTFTVPLDKPIRLAVTEEESGLETMTNPISTSDAAPLWGDLHACIDDDEAAPELDFELAVGANPTLTRTSFTFQTDESSGEVLRYSLPDVAREEMVATHLLEIYSCWGNREHWGGRYPDIRIDRHPDRMVHAVLSRGVVAGFAAGSNSRLGIGTDAVRAEAGRGFRAGLTGVLSEALTQTAIFDALRGRRCYATTGHRPLIRFYVDDHVMGSIVEVEDADRDLIRERTIKAEVFGTQKIDRIEVIRNNVEICTYRGDDVDASFFWVDQQDLTRIVLQREVRGRSLSCYYYLRIIQEDGDMAWTSPIWFLLKP